MKSLTDIAVVVPCFNLGAYVEEAVDSVLEQTRPAGEIVVVDDGSTDVATRQVLARLQRPRTRVITMSHAGVAAARDHGIACCQAPYIVLLDADDLLAPQYLERAAERLDSDDGLAFVSCALQAFGGASYQWTPPSCTLVNSLTHGTVHISSMFRRSMWRAVGGFDPALPAYEDMDFWLRALSQGFTGDILDEPLLFYRVREHSRYRAAIEPETYLAAMGMIISKHLDLLETRGHEALLAKESFLLHIIEHEEHLRHQRAALTAELAELRQATAEARRALAQHRGDPRSATAPRFPPSWRDAVAGRYFRMFLHEQRWLVRGEVALISNAPNELDSLQLERWDSGVDRRAARLLGPDDLRRAARESLDCVILLGITPLEGLESLIARSVSVMRRGGALLVAMLANPHPRVATVDLDRSMQCDQLRDALARFFPLDAFEVAPWGNLATFMAAHQGCPAESLAHPDFKPQESRYAVIVTGAAQKPGSGVLLRAHWPKPVRPLPRTAGAAILAYHRVASHFPDTHRLNVSPAGFQEQMRYIKDQCTPMRLEELLWAARAGGLPPRAVAVTLDDGYLDGLTTAAPILAEHHVPATFFVNTDRLDHEHEAWHDTMERVLLSEGDLPAVMELSLAGETLRLDVTTAEQRAEALMTLHCKVMSMTAEERHRAVEQLVAWSGRTWKPRPSHRVLLGEEISPCPGCPGAVSALTLLTTCSSPDTTRMFNDASCNRPSSCWRTSRSGPCSAFAIPLEIIAPS